MNSFSRFGDGCGLDSIRTLQGTLGYPLMEAPSNAAAVQPEEILRCTAKTANARGIFNNEGFTVLAGSICVAEPTASAKNSKIPSERKRLLEQGVITIQPNGQARFVKEHVFRSPSGASGFVLYAYSNGWVAWKNHSGQTLHEINEPAVTQGDGAQDE